MQMSEQVKKTIKVVVICVVIFILLLLVYHFFINRVGQVKPQKEKPLNYAVEVVNDNYQNPEYCSGNYFIIENNENNNLKTLILNDDLNIIESLNVPKSAVYCLYDDYYLIKNNETYTLKRRGSIIASNIDFSYDLNEIYHESSSSNALYISKSYLDAVVNNKNHFMVSNKVAYASNILINMETGKTIDDKLTAAYKVNILNGEDTKYLYLEGLTSYLYNINNGQKYLENKNIIFAKNENNEVTNNSQNNVVFKDEVGIGVADFKGNIIIKPDAQNIQLESSNSNYFAVNRNGKYGLVNAFGNTVWDFTYDNIIVLDEFILAITNKNLNIFDTQLKQINEKEYLVKDTQINVIKYAKFYQIQSVINNTEQELIITKDGQLNTITGLRPILYGEYFYDKDCYLINDAGKAYIYVDDNTKFVINLGLKNNVDNAIMLNNNRLYTDFMNDNKIQYGYYRINSGTALGSYLKDKVDVTIDVIKYHDLVFSRENEKISVYYNNTLKDEIEAQKISHLNDDYYALTTSEKVSMVKIIQKK